MNFDKSNWTAVCLADVANEVSARVDNPSETEFDRFVGLEHFDSGELKIHRWGSTQDLVSAMKLFQAGDTLLARRNVYLKRSSLVEFDGICSGDAIVLREKGKSVVKGYLAFVLNTEDFWKYAIANADGSMSKRINVKNLLKYTFKLPPIDEQQRIAKLFWAADNALEKHRGLLENAKQCLDLALTEIFDKLAVSSTLIEFSEVGNWRSGGTPSRQVDEYWNGSIPWVSPKDMKTEEICDSIEKITDKAVTDGVAGAKLLPAETIIFVVRGMILAHTFPVAITKCPVTINQDMKAIFVSKGFDPLYVFYWLKYESSHILKMTEESSHGTKRLATEMLGKLMIPLVSIERQKEIVSKFQMITHVIKDSELHIEQTTILRKNLCNKLIGGVSDV